MEPAFPNAPLLQGTRRALVAKKVSKERREVGPASRPLGGSDTVKCDVTEQSYTDTLETLEAKTKTRLN